ncbi:MAG: transglutaminase-like family protein [Blastochloris sp.]|nr:transglutaminase-like family protein [Blastochloris sp.]
MSVSAPSMCCPHSTPHIPTQTPLIFEWVHGPTRKVLQAAEWNCWLPEGQSYPNRPQNSQEALRRFSERWKPRPDLVGNVENPPKSEPAFSQKTLDLRWFS